MHAKDQTLDLPQGDALPVPAGGSIMRGAHFYAVRVFFEDTDLSGVAYHANYLRWFERARSDLLRMLHIDQRAAHEAGEGAYAVSDLAIRYASPARLDDDVLIETRAVQIGRASCKLNQRAWRGAAPGKHCWPKWMCASASSHPMADRAASRKNGCMRSKISLPVHLSRAYPPIPHP